MSSTTKKQRQFKGNVMLLITAMIWGSAFVAQSAGMDYVGPFTYGMSRNFIGFIVLIPVVIIFRRKCYLVHPMSTDEKKALNKRSVTGGIFCGIALAVASSFQQVGVSMTTAGKAGFITAIYIVIVPILGIFLKKKVPKIIWLCIVIAIIGFYLLCINDGFSISTGDLLCLVCAVGFSVHILVIDHFTSMHTDSIMMACTQFLVAGLISLVLMLMFEAPTLSAIWEAKVTILYAGVLSSGVAYTLQMVAQRDTNPTVAVLLMSLESVFAVIFGGLILGESMTTKEIMGCILVFIAVILAQVPLPERKHES